MNNEYTRQAEKIAENVQTMIDLAPVEDRAELAAMVVANILDDFNIEHLFE